MTLLAILDLPSIFTPSLESIPTPVLDSPSQAGSFWPLHFTGCTCACQACSRIQLVPGSMVPWEMLVFSDAVSTCDTHSFSSICVPILFLILGIQYWMDQIRSIRSMTPRACIQSRLGEDKEESGQMSKIISDSKSATGQQNGQG